MNTLGPAVAGRLAVVVVPVLSFSVEDCVDGGEVVVLVDAVVVVVVVVVVDVVVVVVVAEDFMS